MTAGFKCLAVALKTQGSRPKRKPLCVRTTKVHIHQGASLGFAEDSAHTYNAASSLAKVSLGFSDSSFLLAENPQLRFPFRELPILSTFPTLTLLRMQLMGICWTLGEQAQCQYSSPRGCCRQISCQAKLRRTDVEARHSYILNK